MKKKTAEKENLGEREEKDSYQEREIKRRREQRTNGSRRNLKPFFSNFCKSLIDRFGKEQKQEGPADH